MNEKDSNRLETLHKCLGISKSKIFRKSLEMLYKLDTREVDLSLLFEYLHIMNDRKHIAINREMMQEIAEEVDRDNGEINEKFFEIGKFYWREYEEMDKETVEDVLKHLEKHNWFRAIKKGDGKFTLELRVKKSCKLFKNFLKGVFESSPYKVQLEEIRGKILLKTSE